MVDDIEDGLRTALVTDLDAGFADVVRAHERTLYSVALQLTHRPADAEDLAADTLLRAYRALRGYDAKRVMALRVRPWLLTILRNTARNAARDASRRPAPPPGFETAEEPSVQQSVEDQAEHGEAQRMLGAALAQLPDVQRLAVTLRHVVDLPISEVAEVLGCPEGTAKSHISRGLQRLRSVLPAAEPSGGVSDDGSDREVTLGSGRAAGRARRARVRELDGGAEQGR